MSHEATPEQIEIGRRLANEIFDELITPHEQEDHGGEPCRWNRIGTIAYFAHTVGLHAEDLVDMVDVLDDYDVEHQRRHAEGNGHG